MKIWLIDKKQNFESHENKRFQDEAEKMGIELRKVAPENFDIVIAGGEQGRILYEGNCEDQVKCSITRLGSGTTYFALATLRHLENLGILVLNSSDSIEVGRDKLATMQVLATHRIPIPKTMLAKFPLDIDLLEKEFSYPVIIKPVSGSKGRGIFLCESKMQMTDLIELIEVSIDPKVNVIIQEFISTSRGKDIRVIVVGGRAIGAMLRRAKEGKFKANFSAGGSVAPYELNEAVEWLAVESARVIGLDIAGIDILFDGDSYKVCEVNCAPGFRGFEKATEINVPQEIFQYIHLRLKGILKA
jgi:gamma-F420-2:alpha-L-glutamate ligase